jgi:hypothetical protein
MVQTIASFRAMGTGKAFDWFNVGFGIFSGDSTKTITVSIFDGGTEDRVNGTENIKNTKV